MRSIKIVVAIAAALLIGAPPCDSAEIFEKVGSIRHLVLETGFGARSAWMVIVPRLSELFPAVRPA